ncbi:MAG: tRNA (guanosine(37)-N1)-methyltransferase TrmD [Candidatus Omnitrophica bacterium]|nr:tRNA (guanosine(37)-N1)-methyltransferase TrmD [Candidatus Omnitrophota bacterium]
MRCDVLTAFPEMFPGVLGASILKRAQASGRLRIAVHDLRDYTHDKRRTLDDRPYGGGPGMVMRVEPIAEAVEALRAGCRSARHRSCQTILLTPAGERLTSSLAKELAGVGHLVLICGHYEGVDERVRELLVDRSLSIGDYVLTGGELPAMVLIDCMARFVPGVLGHREATVEESFSAGWLEYPQYTRPTTFREKRVPDVLLSGDHERIARWRKLQAAARTLATRPDLATNGRRREGGQRRG